MTPNTPDIDAAIAEFSAAVRGLFERSEIDRLKASIIRCQLEGLPTVFYRQELCERLGAQIMREVA